MNPTTIPPEAAEALDGSRVRGCQAWCLLCHSGWIVYRRYARGDIEYCTSAVKNWNSIGVDRARESWQEWHDYGAVLVAQVVGDEWSSIP